MKRIVIAITVALVLLAATVPLGSVGAIDHETDSTDGQESGYAGTYVSFQADSGGITDYRVDGETILESVSVQSEQRAAAHGSVEAGAELSAVTNLAGAGASLQTEAMLSASVSFESDAQMNASDTPKGTLLVHAGEHSQYVTANISSASSASQESDSRVVVTDDSGRKGAFVVVGDGDVSINEQGNVAAKLEQNATLVFRTYPDGREEADEKQEALIANGKAAAEVTVTKTREGGEYVADITQYATDITIEVTRRTAGNVEMTVERSTSEGRVIITSVSKEVIRSADDVRVTVDGEAAVEASSYSDLKRATENGDSSKYTIRQRSNAEATVEVAVAISHFSKRQLAIQSTDDTSSGDGGGDERTASGSMEATQSGSPGTSQSDSDGEGQQPTDSSGAGFTAVAAILTVLGATLLAVRRR